MLAALSELSGKSMDLYEALKLQFAKNQKLAAGKRMDVSGSFIIKPKIDGTPAAAVTVTPTPAVTPVVKPTPAVTPVVKPTPAVAPVVKPTPAVAPVPKPAAVTPVVKPETRTPPTV